MSAGGRRRAGGAGTAGGTVRIRGGVIHDPRHGRSGETGDILIEDGRVVASLPAGAPVFDAKGLVVMPGGVDLHSHIASPAVREARRLCAAEAGGPCLPSIGDTGRRYALMGYTTVFDAAVAPSGARPAHDDLDAMPIVDKGIYVLAGNHALALDAVASGRRDELAAVLAWLVRAARAHAVKVVNPGGVAAWRDGAPPPADAPALVRAFAAAVATLGLPHPLHLHLPGLGQPGNAALTLRCLEALGSLPAHVTHLQFHAYGGRTMRGFRSRAPEIATWINSHPNLTADVGQVVFGPAVTLSADTPAQDRLRRLTRRRWLSLDVESETGCGIVPHDYDATSRVTSVQWAAGLELMLLLRDPWRIALTTDHPNGGPFAAYPLIVRLLMDRAFREAMLARAHPETARRTSLGGLAREYTLDEIAIVTRAGPARILGLERKGHLGPGADGDVTLYRRDTDLESMFAAPVAVFKDGRLVARDGEILDATPGRTLYAAPRPQPADADAGAIARRREAHDAISSVPFDDLAIDTGALARSEEVRAW
jgi:formylmethanofuran dehydrogenase subunit A